MIDLRFLARRPSHSDRAKLALTTCRNPLTVDRYHQNMSSRINCSLLSLVLPRMGLDLECRFTCRYNLVWRLYQSPPTTTTSRMKRVISQCSLGFSLASCVAFHRLFIYVSMNWIPRRARLHCQPMIIISNVRGYGIYRHSSTVALNFELFCSPFVISRPNSVMMSCGSERRSPMFRDTIRNSPDSRAGNSPILVLSHCVVIFSPERFGCNSPAIRARRARVLSWIILS